jgi:hypothetical protein
MLDADVLNDPYEEIKKLESQIDETAADELMKGRNMSADEAVAYALDRSS